ncbi:leucine-rich repeat domain-containing protein [Ascoidea rubescens DSM 1968]|uniref:L domain-like protein n=1 Tax=Ascoidea rubescens DSM 1968 TaxID=1344418 RepID=A0A1D2VR94_9ASCO|nr:L domain-like protein [Ascoidea rubescens DSM 1968]ODV64132.1 L domain-like protein [Ascoidea rubescens DSM 1968]
MLLREEERVENNQNDNPIQVNQQQPIEVIRNFSFTNIQPLAKLTLLKRLNLSGNYLSKVSCLKRLTLLIDLNISNNQITNIKFLSGLTKLKRLSFPRNNIEDIRYLSTLENLVHLEGNDNEIKNIDPIINLQKLRELLLDNNQIFELGEINKLQDLVNLSLNQNLIENVKNTLFFTGNEIYFKKLRRIRITHNVIKDLRNIYIPENVEYFNFSRNKINMLSIANVNKLSKLKVLKLNQNSLTKLKYFEILTIIHSIDLNQNHLTHFSFRTRENQDNLIFLLLHENELSETVEDYMNISPNVKIVYLSSWCSR